MSAPYCVGCGASSSLQCPECKAFFCGKICFKRCWKLHKLTHQNLKIISKTMTNSHETSIKGPLDIVMSGAKDLQLLNVDTYARTLFATREFPIGSVVFNESPLIIFTNVEYLIQQYMTMDANTKEKLFDLQHYKSSDRAMNSLFQLTLDETWEACSKTLADFNQPLNMIPICAEEMYNISTVCIVNSHGFISINTSTDDTVMNCGSQYETLPSSSEPSSDQNHSALFSLGSKVTHSCYPNCAYSSLFIKNTLTYFSVLPIAAGDMLTFSYVDYMCTKDRRYKLLISKDFFCTCVKCVSPDYAYGVKCECIDCIGVKLGTCTVKDGITNWKCLVCGNIDSCNTVDDDIESIEDSFNAIKAMYIINGERFYSQTYVEMMEELIIDCIAIFCQTHYLVTVILQEISKLLICGADFFALHGTAPMTELCRIRTLAAMAGLRAVKTIECVEAGCILGKLCTVEHSPSHHCTGDVLEACNQLLSSSSASNNTDSYTILTSLLLPIRISKYMQLLDGVYHPSHCEVSRIRLGLGLEII